MKIETDYWRKPGPTNKFDWSATFDNYEGGDGYDEQPGPVGYGTTEQEAIDDLLATAPPCKNEGPWVEHDGTCLKCGAVQGEACR